MGALRKMCKVSVCEGNFGEFLKKARSDLGLTQKQLAAKCEVPLQSVVSYENDRRMPKAVFLLKLHGILQREVERLSAVKIPRDRVSKEAQEQMERLTSQAKRINEAESLLLSRPKSKSTGLKAIRLLKRKLQGQLLYINWVRQAKATLS